MRKEEALLMTGYPASAKASSEERATSEGKLETTTSQSSGGCGGCTTIDLTKAGMSPTSRHVQASPYDFPCERSDAAKAVISNSGCFSSIRTKRWPTIPVAPRIPTRTRLFGTAPPVEIMVWMLQSKLQCFFAELSRKILAG